METDIINKKRGILNYIVLFFILIPIFFIQVQAQTEAAYKGKLALPEGTGSDVSYYQNSVVISIDNSGTVTGTVNFRGGSASKDEEYIHFSGAFKGKMHSNSFEAAGSPTLLVLDKKQESTDHVSFRMSGQLSSDGNSRHIAGKMAIVNNEQDGGTQSLSFTATQSAGEGLQLTFPLGISPKVFDKGWKFGASCILNEGTDNEVDLSENIRWNGTATFTPDKGPLSSPVFTMEGSNKIVLSVADAQGNKYEKEFKVEVVKASLYAHTGCYAVCSADTHGCPACPHYTVGFIRGSAADVTINGLTAVVVGDNGTHSACCGANTFKLNEGDPEVLINGKEAVLLGAQTEECGGRGIVKKSVPALGVALSANDSAFYIDPWGELDKVNGDRYKRLDTKYVGTTYVTHEKGSLTLSLFPKGILSAGPNTQLTILSDESGVLKIKVDKGNIFFNGQSSGQGEVVIELKDCGLVLKGTRFSLSVSDQSMKLDLLEGKVDLKFNKSGETVPIQEGESVLSDFNSVTETKSVDPLAVNKQWQQIAENTPGIRAVENIEEGNTNESGWLKYLNTNVLLIAGVVFIIIIIAWILLRKKKKLSKGQKNPGDTPSLLHHAEYSAQPGPVTQATKVSSPKFCPSCGNPLKPGSKFCGKCGFNTLQQERI